MAFCTDCGKEIPEGVKFCPNCGAPVKEENKNRPAVVPGVEKKARKTGIDRFGGFISFLLLILAIVDCLSNPPALTFVLAIVIIAGTLFCFSRKYKGKLFAIIALLLALYCLISSINQGKREGFFTASKQASETTVVESNTKKNDVKEKDTKENDTKESDKKEVDRVKVQESTSAENESAAAEEPQISTETETVEETQSSEEIKTATGVNPELKAYLDTYEAFMIEYVEFMKKYSEDSGNAILMMADYLKMLERYQEFAEKLDEYKDEDMSTEDMKYYMEVMNRCNMMLLDLE